jgi:hypothetical protein
VKTTLAEFTLVRDCALGTQAATLGTVLDSPILRRAAESAGPTDGDPDGPNAVALSQVDEPGGTAQMPALGSRSVRPMGFAPDRASAVTPAPDSDEARRVQSVASSLHVRNPDSDLLILIDGATADEPTKELCRAVFILSDHLADSGDAVSGPEVLALATKLTSTEETLVARLMQLRDAAGDAIVLMLPREVSPDELADATRLWWVCQLILALIDHRRDSTAEAVRRFLARQLFVPGELSDTFPRAEVAMVRRAAVSDLYVVRSEWRGYTRGEVAALKNVMAGEKFARSATETRESETIDVTDTTQASSQETSEESRSSSELSREVTSQLTASLKANVNGEVTGAFPGGTYRVGANAEGSVGLAVSERLAARTSQESVERAVSKIDTTVRSTRTVRELTRSVDETRYELSNLGKQNRRGVYRWLERVERFQVFRIPHRLQLEFQLPNPAEFFAYRQRRAAQSEKSGGPPDWLVTLDQTPTDSTLHTIATQSDADKLATLYHATDLPSLPKETVSVLETKSLDGKPVPADNKADQVVSPVASGDVDMVIPDGYEATEVRYFMSASPARARWTRERGNNDNAHKGWDNADQHVFHSIVAEAFIGGESHYVTDWIGEDQGLDELLTTQGNAYDVSTGFGSAYARSTTTQVVKLVDGSATPPRDAPVRTKLRLGFKATGAAHLEVGVQVICRRTPERYASWRQQVYETLLAAWTRWQREADSAREAGLMFGTSVLAEGSSSDNRQVIVEELKRQIISWLLEEVPFKGRPGMKPRKRDDKTPWREFDTSQVLQDAATVQFFEQAFDWSNLGWIFYPYYWASQDDWVELAGNRASDPEFERFLRSGAARVLLPVRPSFEKAVKYWIAFRKPFLGKGLPLPNHPMFISLASEVRNLTEAAADGQPVDRAWDVKTSTTFTWLDEGTAVPSNRDVTYGDTDATRPLHPVTIE